MADTSYRDNNNNDDPVAERTMSSSRNTEMDRLNNGSVTTDPALLDFLEFRENKRRMRGFCVTCCGGCCSCCQPICNLLNCLLNFMKTFGLAIIIGTCLFICIKNNDGDLPDYLRHPFNTTLAHQISNVSQNAVNSIANATANINYTALAQSIVPHGDGGGGGQDSAGGVEPAGEDVMLDESSSSSASSYSESASGDSAEEDEDEDASDDAGDDEDETDDDHTPGAAEPATKNDDDFE